MILYRPVSLQEVALIYDSGMKSFPARLPKQPIFYPVLQLEYARQTALKWNARSGQSAGYVTQFKVEDEYIDRFEEHAVGKTQYQELWIPAEEMEEFNRHIVGHIKVVEAYFGNAFEGFVPEQFALKGKNAVEQFTLLANSYLYKRMDFYLEIKRNHKAVFLNYPFWLSYDFKNPGLKEKIIQAIKEAWLTSFPTIPLPNPLPTDISDIKPVQKTDLPALANRVQKDNTPVKRTPTHTKRPMKLAREDITPVEPNASDAQDLTDTSAEDVTSEEETDSGPFDDSFDEEPTPAKQSHAQHWMDPADEDGSSEEETDSDSFDDSFDEEPTPAKQSHVQHWMDPVDEDGSSEEETDSDSFDDSLDEDITPVKQTPARHWVNAHDDDATPARQTHSYFMQGIQLGLSEKYPEASEELSRAVEVEPDHVVARTSLGVALHRLGEDDRALASYESALKLDPVYAEAHYFRANILYSQGNVHEAIAGYTVAIGLQPELIEAHRKPRPEDRLTDYYSTPAEMRWIAKPAHRILDLNKSLESSPRQANLFKERAAQYYRLRNYAQTIADYNSALALHPEDASALHLRGVAYEQLGQHDRAQEDYQRAIAINPQLSNEYLQRGVTLGQMGNLDQSIASLTEAIRLAPRNPDSYFNRGTAYIQQMDFERAIEDFSDVIRLSPADEEAYYWRGIAYEETGHQREAIDDYRQFLALSRDENARAQIQQKLSQWNEAKLNDLSSQSRVPDDRKETNQVPFPSREPAHILDLYDLIAAFGERALHSTWFGSGVNCSGEKAEELYALTNQDKPIRGRDFLSIVSGIRKTRQGDFQAFDPGANTPWLFIRAWDGSGFYVETNDPGIKAQLKTHFPSIEEVDGASPSYDGFFLSIQVV